MTQREDAWVCTVSGCISTASFDKAKDLQQRYTSLGHSKHSRLYFFVKGCRSVGLFPLPSLGPLVSIYLFIYLFIFTCQFRNMLSVQDDGTFGDDADSPAVAPSPGSVSLGTDSSEDEDDEDGDAGEHRMNVRTGQ